MTEKTDVRRKTRDYDQQNLIAAEIILANPERVGGPESFCVVWARRFTIRIENEKRLHKPKVLGDAKQLELPR